MTGQADISGIGPRGVRIEIECKTLKGRQQEAQIAFQNMIEKHGGIYIIARDARTACGALAMAFKRRAL